MFVFKCDKCGKLSEPQEKNLLMDNWETITYSTYCGSVIKHLCPDCATALKIPREVRGKTKLMENNLIEILSEIAREAVQS